MPNRVRAVDGFQRNWRFAPSRRLKSRKILSLWRRTAERLWEPGRGRCEEGNAGFGQDRAGGRLRRRRRFGWRGRVCARDRPGKTGAGPATGQAGRGGQAEALRRVQRPHRRERADQGRGLHRSDQGRQARASRPGTRLSQSRTVGERAGQRGAIEGRLQGGDPHLQRADPGLADAALLLHPTRRDLSDDRRSRPRHPGLQRRHPARAARDLSADQSRRAALSQEGQQRGRHRRPDGGAQAQAVRGLRLGQPRHRLQAQGRDRQGHHRLQRRHQVPAAQDRADPAERRARRHHQPALDAAAGAEQPRPAGGLHLFPARARLLRQAAVRQGDRRFQRGHPDQSRRRFGLCRPRRRLPEQGRAAPGDRRLQRGPPAVAGPGLRPSAARHRLSPHRRVRQGARGLRRGDQAHAQGPDALRQPRHRLLHQEGPVRGGDQRLRARRCSSIRRR